MRTPAIGNILLGSLVALSLAAPASAAPFTVTPDGNASNLLASLLGDTSGLSGITGGLSGDPLASGLFTDDPFGLIAGVILSTGNVTTVVGPNDSDSDGTDLGSSGVPGDTVTLTVNFTSDASVSNLFFNYVFGSEEFFEYIGSQFNDFFTLKLDGINYAKLACGSDVAINNFVGACASELVDNGGGLITQLDAYTNTLLFSAPLTPGAHSLQLSIGDVGDGSYDSAVFIQGNSLGTTDPSAVPEPTSLLLLGSGLVAAARRRLRSGGRQA